MRFAQFYLGTIVLTVLPVAADLRNRMELLRSLRTSEERYRLLAAHSTDILVHLDLQGRILYISPSITKITGFDADSLVGTFARDIVPPDQSEVLRAGYLATLAERGESHSFEYIALTSSGERLWFESSARALLDEQGNIEGTLSMVRDISARKEKELKLSHDALTDTLTGLPNRRAFEEAVAARAATDRAVGRDCVAIFDIDRFKRVNDTFGHDGGDAVLQTFARVLRSVVRNGDCIARLGGEEFVVLFPDTQVPQALMVCERLREEMARATTETGFHTIGVTVSGGVAQLAREGLDHALKQADQALYAAKRGGRNQMALAA